MPIFSIFIVAPLSDKIQRNEIQQLDLPANALFSIFIIFAVLLEKRLEKVGTDEEGKFIIERIENGQFYILNLFKYTCLSRFKLARVCQVKNELKRFNLTVEQISLINQWTQREVDLVDQAIVETTGDSEV